SRTARMSSILVSSGPRSRGRSESPVPRLSNMIRREKEAKRLYIPRQSELAHGKTRLLNCGTRTRSRGPSPNVWYAIATSPLRVYSISGTSTIEVSHREWGREDSNLRRLSRRVYSPFPLATRAHPREDGHCSGASRLLSCPRTT